MKPAVSRRATLVKTMTRAALVVSLLATCGCAPTAEQQAAAFTPNAATLEARAEQSRRFDTTDRKLMLQSALGALQDMGFSIEESQAQSGVIVASKLANGRIRAEVVIRPAADRASIIVRATFQEISPAPGAMLAHGATLRDPLLYQGFFDRMSQSAFLTANGI
jgi:hypothetical protein